MNAGEAINAAHAAKTPAPCGTYAGLNRHKREGTTPCEGCRTAGRDYIRARRAQPEHRLREQRRAAIRDKARHVLAARHRAEYLSLVKDLVDREEL